MVFHSQPRRFEYCQRPNVQLQWQKIAQEWPIECCTRTGPVVVLVESTDRSTTEPGIGGTPIAATVPLDATE